jgi:LPS-assembly lipoprotein
MSWSRRGFLALALLPLPACGFQPILATGSPARALIGRVALAGADDQMEFDLREALELNLGQASDPVYRLDFSIETDSEGLAITPDASITRFNLSASADYVLTRLADDGVAAQGTVRSFTAYSATASAFATRVAEKDARRRLAVSLADQIAARLAAAAAAFGP